MQPQSLFITGTDTGVGKTMVTALLALRLQASGIDVGVMKPFASGCRRENGELISEDAEWLKAISGVDDDLTLINPVRFEEPLAPVAAARRAGRSTQDLMDEALRAYRVLQRQHECVLVEGIGGLLVPIREAPGPEPMFQTCADFAEALGLPVLVVARRTLGTINHSALTCRVKLCAPAHFAGLIFCDAQPVAPEDVAAQTGPAIIEEMTRLQCWGVVPYLQDQSRQALAEAARQCLEQP
ncbi:MAG: dethiobiotin synthase [Armatimonadota bacterium]|nr:dethiobiotin synthase [Armatimonadota bacterium]